jgi:tetratricopeptide (TPR) repeat protein
MDRQSRLDMLLELLSIEPDDLFLNYALGVEYQSGLRLADAEKHFKKSLQINPDYVPAFYQLGKLFESQLKNEEALIWFKSGLEKAKIQKNNKAVNEFGEAIFMLED